MFSKVKHNVYVLSIRLLEKQQSNRGNYMCLLRFLSKQVLKILKLEKNANVGNRH